MALEASQPLKISAPAAADLSASQYLAVKRDASGNVVVVTAATDEAIGILQNKPKAAGQMCEIVVIGVTKMVAVGVIAPVDAVAFDAAGKAVTAARTGFGGGYVQGTKRAIGQPYNLTANTAASDVVAVTVNFLNPNPAT